MYSSQPQDRLFESVTRAVALGYRVHTCRLEMLPHPRTGVPTKTVTAAPPKLWHEQPQQSEESIRAAIARGHTAYLIHCPSSGVTLLDGDTASDLARHRELTGVGPHVVSPSGPDRAHTYVAGSHTTALDPKVKHTAFGPGSYVVTPNGPLVYTGALPERSTLPVISEPAAAPPVEQSTAQFFASPPGTKTIGSGIAQYRRLRSQMIDFVRSCVADPRRWDHGVLVRLTRELASLAPDTAMDDVAECWAIAGASYVDDRVWAMLRSALAGYAPDLAYDPRADASFAFVTPERFADRKPPAPAAYGALGGAEPLFYATGVHWLQGESESGKSWVAYAVALDVLRQGGAVLVVDHEDTEHNVLERFAQLGCTPELARGLVYVGGHDVAHSALVEHLRTTDRDYALLVVDGVTSALSAAGLSGRDEQEITAWTDALPRRARAAVCIDHVVKATDERRGMAIGSQAKKAVVTGTAFEVVAEQKFGRGSSGVIRLNLQKDKQGSVRGRGVSSVVLQFASDPATGAVTMTAGAEFFGSVMTGRTAVFATLYDQGFSPDESGNELNRRLKEHGQAVRRGSALSEVHDEYRTYCEHRNSAQSVFARQRGDQFGDHPPVSNGRPVETSATFFQVTPGLNGETSGDRSWSPTPSPVGGLGPDEISSETARINAAFFSAIQDNGLSAGNPFAPGAGGGS